MQNNIKTDVELFDKAKEQKEPGKKDLENFEILVYQTLTKSLLSNAWKMES